MAIYNSEEDEWTTTGHLSIGRDYHAMSLVPSSTVDFCVWPTTTTTTTTTTTSTTTTTTTTSTTTTISTLSVSQNSKHKTLKCPSFQFLHISTLDILVAGGHGDGSWTHAALASVEVLSSDGSPLCTLPDLPEARWGLTLSDSLACGGYGSGAANVPTCVNFTGGQSWEVTHNLAHNRRHHSSWASAQGQILMGGYNGLESTELLSDSGDGTSAHFPLNYRTV